MQAITTYYIPATNFKPSRIKAKCQRGSITVSYDHSGEESAHINAAKALCAKFVAEDAKEYGSVRESNPWASPFVTGCLPDGGYAHVFTK